jgi:multiple sugar transport system ATP-binding protein
MRAEIGALHLRLSATMIYVTHDQVEAMTMGDKIVVMKGGIIQQIGSPLKLYNEPINRFVAGFIGSPPMNIAIAKVSEEGGKILITEEGMTVSIDDDRKETLKAYVGKELLVGIRPEDLDFTTTPVDNNMSAKVVVIEPLGAETQLHINTGSHTFTTKNEPTIQVKVGDTVNFTPRLEKLHFFDLETERSLFYTED